jgi:TonB family protein
MGRAAPFLQVYRMRSNANSNADSGRIDLLPVVTLVLWLMCLLVGLIDHFITSTPPAAPPPATKPTEAALVDVSLNDSSASLAQSSEATPMTLDTPAPILPAMPPLPAVTPVSPAIAFAVPVEGPVRIVAAAQAVVQPRPRQPAAPQNTGPVYTQIYYGKGEGNQPKPEYPYECQIAGQTGTVVVEFVVAQDGTIASATVAKPCQWPLLNQAAERSIRENWTYSSGPVRHYRINIVYAQKPK